jgi:hypothetical protein
MHFIQDLQAMNFMQDLQALSWLATAVTATATGIVAVFTFRDSLRWKRANAADSLIEAMHTNPDSSKGIMIFDWLYDGVNALHGIKTYGEVRDVLLKFNGEGGDGEFLTKQEIEVLRNIDWFFYYIDRMEQNVRNKFFDFDHVKWIFLPYYLKLKNDLGIFDLFAKKRHYVLAPFFWRRFMKEQFWINDTRRLPRLARWIYSHSHIVANRSSGIGPSGPPTLL